VCRIYLPNWVTCAAIHSWPISNFDSRNTRYTYVNKIDNSALQSTHSVEHKPSWETNRSSANQGITRTDTGGNCLLLLSILSHSNSAHALPPCFLRPVFNLLAPELIFLILAHPVNKMWIIQEPNTLELWNKLHFEDKKTESIYRV